jgi:hypothetical protein
VIRRAADGTVTEYRFSYDRRRSGWLRSAFIQFNKFPQQHEWWREYRWWRQHDWQSVNEWRFRLHNDNRRFTRWNHRLDRLWWDDWWFYGLRFDYWRYWRKFRCRYNGSQWTWWSLRDIGRSLWQHRHELTKLGRYYSTSDSIYRHLQIHHSTTNRFDVSARTAVDAR